MNYRTWSCIKTKMCLLQLLHTVKPPRAVPVDCAFFDNDRLAVLYGAGVDFHLAEVAVSTRRFTEWNVPLKDAFQSQGRRSSGSRSPRSISVADEQVIVVSDDKFVVVRRQPKVQSIQTSWRKNTTDPSACESCQSPQA